MPVTVVRQAKRDVLLLRAPVREIAGELAGIAGLVHGREDAAGELVLCRRQGRLGPGEAVAVDDLDAEAVVGQQAHMLRAVVEALLRAEEIEDAAIPAVEVDPVVRSTSAFRHWREYMVRRNLRSVLMRARSFVHSNRNFNDQNHRRGSRRGVTLMPRSRR